MKKIVCLCLLVALAIPFWSACAHTSTENEKITVVATVFPEYDWARQILGNTVSDVELLWLTQSGTDLHSYQPTVSDMAAIASCDILIYAGGTSDAWIGDALSSSPSDNRRVVRLMDLLSDEEKLVEQSQHHNTEHHHDETYDEHIWLSVKNALRFCSAICDALCETLPEHQDYYRSNFEKYAYELKNLDQSFSSVVSASAVKTLLFADRFPFSYLTHDYGITCYAAFPGCSAETEASFETIAYLAKTVDTLSLPAIIILENSDGEIARTVRSATKKQSADIIVMDSLQSISKKDIQEGATYLDIMKNNLSALQTALGK